MHPKFIIVSRPDEPLVGRFVYGKVDSHRHLVEGYVKVHGGGWYEKDDEKKTMLLYGSSGDYGPDDVALAQHLYAPKIHHNINCTL